MAKARYSKPTSQVDLDERLKNENRVTGILKDTNPADSSVYYAESGFVGTDPIYQNYANDTDEPLKAESGADKQAEDYVKKQVTGTAEKSPETKTATDSQPKTSTENKS